MLPCCAFAHALTRSLTRSAAGRIAQIALPSAQLRRRAETLYAQQRADAFAAREAEISARNSAGQLIHTTVEERRELMQTIQVRATQLYLYSCIEMHMPVP
eukprot:COSAG05_NODE_379_length_10567_cov_18.553687_17_plen_101_part_00